MIGQTALVRFGNIHYPGPGVTVAEIESHLLHRKGVRVATSDTHVYTGNDADAFLNIQKRFNTQWFDADAAQAQRDTSLEALHRESKPKRFDADRIK